MQNARLVILLFTQKHIALSPAKEVLLWYEDFLLATLPGGRKPLHEVWS